MKHLRGRHFTILACFIAVLLWATSVAAATVTVTSTADGRGICPGPTCGAPQSCPGIRCTLRLAIEAAASGDTINFALPANSTINLNDGTLSIDNKNLTIIGPGANLLTVQRSDAPGTPAFRVFYTHISSVAISGLTIANGYATANLYGGGGFFVNGGTLTITNSIISGNKTSNTSFGGGGIFGTGSLLIRNSTIAGNSTESSGGGIWAASSLSLTNSTVAGNAAYNGNSGGGIYIGFGATAVITNSTISGNSANGGGGGIATDQAYNLTITNSTVTDNSANPGGGIQLYAGSSNPNVATARNTIIAKNKAPVGPDIIGPLISGGFNLIGDTNNSTITGRSTDILNVDAKLDSLRNNGGPTLTHALLPGSKAIDTGHSSGSNTDQRGFTRRAGNSAVPLTGGDGSDIGAYEYGAEIVQSDCLFDWAEMNYSSGLAPAGAKSAAFAPYYFRYYPQTNAYVGTSIADYHVYYLGPASGHSIFDLGTLLDWISIAGCQ